MTESKDRLEKLSKLSQSKRALLLKALSKEAVKSGERMSIPKWARGSLIPLSFSQQRLWFIDQLEPGTPIYSVPRALRFKGEVREKWLEESINAVVARHESLRT